MGEKLFTIRGTKMFYWRLGNMNSNKQSHWGDPLHHQPPTKRGIWCFPYGHADLFFCWHQWEKHLSKKYRSENQIGGIAGIVPDFDKMSDEEAKVYWDEKERLLKDIRKIYRPVTFWYGGEFYSHISYHGKTDYSNWWLWDNAKAWAKVATKTIFYNERINGKLWTSHYSKDHLEIFIPNY